MRSIINTATAKEETKMQKIKRCRSILFALVLGIGLLGGRVAVTHADDRPGDCDKRIHKAEEQLRKEVDRHGEHSPEADRRRHELEDVRRSCGEEHH
jgi:hypothetical protein